MKYIQHRYCMDRRSALCGPRQPTAANFWCLV